MNTAPLVDPKKYARLANRIMIKVIESEEEYDRMVAAVEQLMNKGEDRLSPEESALLETMAILIQAHDDLREASGVSLMSCTASVSVPPLNTAAPAPSAPRRQPSTR